MPEFVPGIKSWVLGSLRRGPREVNWVPPALGFGNHLYMWLYAWSRQQAGTQSRILYHESMGPWLAAFPRLIPLTIRREDVGLTDRRIIVWGQRFGDEFSPEDLKEFTESCLLVSGIMQNAIDEARTGLDEATLVVNVRRGDYYSVPKFLAQYGMNVTSYVHAAASEAAIGREVSKIRVVSDDPEWCRMNLKSLNQIAPVDFGPMVHSPLADFATLAVADSLVLANSTFSYWGAHLNNVLRDGGYDCIWAPRFHARHRDGGRAWQLDPRWNIIEDVPGGWEPPESCPVGSSA